METLNIAEKRTPATARDGVGELRFQANPQSRNGKTNSTPSQLKKREMNPERDKTCQADLSTRLINGH
jgi:hypothetical protein